MTQRNDSDDAGSTIRRNDETVEEDFSEDVYSVFGLSVESTCPLRGVPSSKGQSTTEGVPDVRIRHGAVDCASIEATKSGHNYRVGDGVICLAYDSVGRFEIRPTEIIVDIQASLSQAHLQQLLLGTAIGAVLQLRGDLVLHASAIDVDGAAVGFLGDAGVGKSTLAAGMYSRGFEVLTDDLLVIGQGAEPDVVPGPPLLKLDPKMADTLGITDPVFSDAAGVPKSYFSVPRRRSADRRPLDRLYVLDSAGEDQSMHLTGGTAGIELVRHTFTARLLDGIDMKESHLDACASVARNTRITRMQPASDLDTLPSVLDQLEADLSD